MLGGQLDAVDDEATEGDLKLRELFEKEERLASRRWGRWVIKKNRFAQMTTAAGALSSVCGNPPLDRGTAEELGYLTNGALTHETSEYSGDGFLPSSSARQPLPVAGIAIQRTTPPSMSPAIRSGARRKSSAFRAGGVSTTTQSYALERASSRTFSAAMYSCTPPRRVEANWK